MLHKSGRLDCELILILALIFIAIVAGAPYYLHWMAVTVCFASLYIMGIFVELTWKLNLL